MVEPTLASIRELLLEIWQVDQREPAPPFAQTMGRVAERLANVGTVSIYGVLVAYACALLIRWIPTPWYESTGIPNHWWFWTAVTFVVVAALRLGLNATKAMKRWNIASLLGSLLVFDLILKKAPTLFGFSGYSPIDDGLSLLGESALGQLIRQVLGF